MLLRLLHAEGMNALRPSVSQQLFVSAVVSFGGCRGLQELYCVLHTKIKPSLAPSNGGRGSESTSWRGKKRVSVARMSLFAILQTGREHP